MMRFFLSTLAALFLTTLPAAAQVHDGDLVKDSVYFMLDDGVMTPEEMEEEAQYVYGLCNSHVSQRLYFDCSCIAGAFLREREKRGPYVLQQDILTELYRTGGKTAKCGNGPLIAGTMYRQCMQMSDAMRRLETNNEQFCQCVGNRIARDFTDYPYMRLQYISRLRMNAMLSCNERFPMVRSFLN